MKIQVIQTLPNGKVTQQVLSKEGAEVLKIHVQPGAKLQFNIEARQPVDNTPAKPRTGDVKKVGNNLVLESEDESLVEVIDFYANDGASLGGVDWNYAATDAKGMFATPEALAAGAAAESAALVPLITPAWFVAGGAAAVAVASHSSDSDVAKPPNLAPVLLAPAAITLIDTVAADIFVNQTGKLSATDAEADPLSYGLTGSTGGATVGGVVYDLGKVGTYGTLYVKSTTGDYVYVPNATAINGVSADQTETFTVTVNDGSSTVTNTLTVNVTGVNDTLVLPPTAITLTDTAAANTFANQTGNLSATDAEGDPLSYGLTGSTGGATVGGVVYDLGKVGTYGTLYVQSATGDYVYVPNATVIDGISADQTETFAITANDGTSTFTNTLTVNVTGANDTPVLLTPTTITLTDNTAVDTFTRQTGTLAATDAEGQAVIYGVTGGTSVGPLVTKVGTYGTLYVSFTTGSYTYTPNDTAINAVNADQTETFTVTANDGTSTVTSTLTVNVTGANDTPVMLTPTAITLTDSAGADAFLDQRGVLSVTDVDTTNFTFGLTGSSATGFNYNLSKVGTYGTLFLKSSTGEYSYVANRTAINALSDPQTETFTVTVNDGTTTVTQTLTVNVTGANDTPVMLTPASITLIDTVAADTFPNQTGNLSATDAEGSPLSYGLTGSALGATVGGVVYDLGKVGTYGTLYVRSATGEYVYVPNATAINGVSAGQTETFTVTANDGTSTVTNTLTVNVTGANDTPVLLDPAAITVIDTVAADTFPNQTGNLSATDAEGSPLSYGLTGSALGATVGGVVYDLGKVGTYGTLYVKSATGDYVYVPNATAINGVSADQTETFTVTANDGTSTVINTLTVNVTGANDTPVLLAPTTITVVDTVAADTFANQTGSLSATDAEGSPLSYGLTGSALGATVGGVVYDLGKVGTYGTLYVKSTTGDYVYVPNATAINGVSADQTETFTVTANDGTSTVTNTLTVNVTGANDMPVLVPAARTVTDTAAADTFSNILGQLSATDAEGDDVTYGLPGSFLGAIFGGVVYDLSKVGTYGKLYISSSNGKYVYVPNATAINALSGPQTESFTVTVNDGTLTSTGTFTVNVTGANDRPVLVSTLGVHTPPIAGDGDYLTLIIGQPVAGTINFSDDFTDADTGHFAITYSLVSVDGIAGATIPGVNFYANGGADGMPTDVSGATYPKDYTIVVRATDGNDPTLYTDHSYVVHMLKAPVVQSISVVDTTGSNTTTLGKAGETLDVSVLFSENVDVVGSPTITLSINGQTVTATYNGTGSGTTTLHFSVAIPSGAAYDGSNISLTGVTANVSGTSVIGQSSGQVWDATPMPSAYTAYKVDNTAPVITASYSVNENTATDTTTKSITLMATNETGPVTWSALAGADAASFTLGTGSDLGKLLFNGVSNFETQTSYSVTLTGTDAAGNATVSQAVSVNLTNVNEAPTLIAPIADASVVKGAAMTAINVASAFADVDSVASGFGTLTYSIIGPVPAGVVIDPVSGLITGTPTVSGSYNLQVQATDGTNSVTDTFVLSVAEAPALAATQALDGVTNLDVRSALVIAFDGPVSLNTSGTQHIKIYDDMDTAGWNHTASLSVLNNTIVDTYNNDVDITLTNGVITKVMVGTLDCTSRFNLNTSVVVNGNNLVIDLKPAVEANHLVVAPISPASTAFDWDFGANYHVELDAGIVTRGGVGSSALSDATTLNFTTVTPVLTTSGAVASKMMDATGALATLSDGYKYLNGNQGNSQATPYGATLDLSGGNYAVVLDSEGTNKSNLGGWIRIQNFSLDGGTLNQSDLIYMDNHGNQSLLTTNSLSVSNPSSWNSDTVNTADSIRKLNAASGGAAMWVTFETPAVGGWTKPINDTAFENATHMNYDAIIFG